MSHYLYEDDASLPTQNNIECADTVIAFAHVPPPPQHTLTRARHSARTPGSSLPSCCR